MRDLNAMQMLDGVRETRLPTAEELLYEQIDADGYDSAVYGCELLRSMYERELELGAALLPDYDVLIEVGVGTGKFAAR
jgi:hypothetical protein